MDENIADFTRRRLAKKPVVYTVVFRHDGNGRSFTVHDVQDTPKDRLAVARDLEAASKRLKSNAEQ